MTQSEVKALLDKYWQAETTLEEEQQLAAWFRQPEIDPAFESYRGMFAWREEEAQWAPGADFDSRMLQRIASEEEAGGDDAHGQAHPQAPVHRMEIRRSVGYAAAAAIILCIGISFFLSIGSGSSPGSPGNPGGEVTANAPVSVATKSPGNIKDTYDDPQKALAAVRHALLIASARISQGRHITQKNIARLHNSWQAATGD